MAKKRVYVETSVLSYLAARPAKDEFKRMCQRQTVMWWERRLDWECFLTTTVLEEISQGDPVAAARRLEKARFLEEQPVPNEMFSLAGLLIARKLVPEGAKTDAMHLATAAIYGADYLLTWNQKHMDNIELRFRIEDFIREQGLAPARVITPNNLLLEE